MLFLLRGVQRGNRAVVLERARAVLAIVAAVATGACSSGKTGASGDGGNDSDQYTCTLQEGGASYVCSSGETWPACPTSTQGSTCPGGTARCMGCTQGAGYYCTCGDTGADSGFLWMCAGTEYPCQ